MKVLISDPVSELGLDILKEGEIEVVYEPNIEVDELKKVIGDIDGWIVRSGTKVTKDLIKKSKSNRKINRKTRKYRPIY